MCHQPFLVLLFQAISSHHSTVRTCATVALQAMTKKRRVYGIAIVILGFIACTFLLGLNIKETRPQPTNSRRVHEALSPSTTQSTGTYMLKSDPKSYCCNDSSAGVSLEVLCGITSGSGDTEECTCIDYMYCRLVVMTGISSNHFEESLDMIASVQKFLPNTKLIVYDLGLNHVERKTMSTYCNVELRTFGFELYPPHVKELFKYAWKPIIYRDVAEEYEVILYMDSSIRLKGNFKDTVLPLLQTFPFVPGPVDVQVSIISLTHEGMLNYLSVSRQEVADVLIHTIQGGVHTTWATQQIKEKLVKYWVDCALHPECIAPPGAGLFGCNMGMVKTNPGKYVGCHRFDQSALNVIVYREFGAEVWRNVQQHNEVVTAVLSIERHPTSFYELERCTPSKYSTI